MSNQSLWERRLKAVPAGVAQATQIFAARGENAEIWDVEGKRYVDFAGGIAVLNTGHRHPAVVAAAKAQIDAVTHTAFQVLPYEPYIALAERLNALAPFKGPAKSAFFTTGAEAVENAVKIARVATGRSGVIAFSGGFHGRSLLTAALTGKVAPYKRGAGAMPAEIYHLPFPIAHQGVTLADTLRALEFLFKADIEPERIAAIIIEPVQGEGGFYPAPHGLLRHLRQICDQHGIILIIDEVQTGFARTGRMFAIEHSGVEPDLLCVAKSIAGGFPLSGVIGKSDLMDRVESGGLGGTYGGNPVACAAALAVLDVIEEENLLERADKIGERITRRLESFASRNDTVPIGAIRSVGAMNAFEIFTDRVSQIPDPAATKRVTAKAAELGLVLLSCGNYANTIRILVPLTVSDAVLDEGLAMIEEALKPQ